MSFVEGAVLREARIHELKDVIREIQATRWWRLRTRLRDVRARTGAEASRRACPDPSAVVSSRP